VTSRLGLHIDAGREREARACRVGLAGSRALFRLGGLEREHVRHHRCGWRLSATFVVLGGQSRRAHHGARPDLILKVLRWFPGRAHQPYTTARDGPGREVSGGLRAVDAPVEVECGALGRNLFAEHAAERMLADLAAEFLVGGFSDFMR